MTPTEQKYREMKNDELKQLLEDFALTTDKAKNPFKPNKDEMVAVLMDYKRTQDIINGIEPEEGDFKLEAFDDETETSGQAVAAPKPTVAAPVLSRAEKARLQKADLKRKEQVIIHDTRNSQTNPPVEMVTWGNRLIGTHTSIVVMGSGKPQYVERGALGNLKEVMITDTDVDENGKTTEIQRKRFQITYLEGMTPEEIAEKAAEQRIRNSRAY